ncbi:MAG: hypothetical protein ABIE03_06070 [Patescibacteria group bacterium]|nr:hypothetical protein [Patescibacteria group bacterium]
MQEFTIPTQEEGSPQPRPAINSSLPPIPTSEIAPDENKPIEPKKKGSNINCFVTILVILNIVSIAAAGVFAYLYFTRNNSVPKDEALPQDSEEKQEKETVDTATVQKIYFTDGYNVFQGDSDGSDQTQLTQYSVEDKGELLELELIGSDNIGFARCITDQNNLDCEIFLLDIQTKEVKTVNQLDISDYLYSLTWRDQDRYAYCTSDGANLQIIYFNGTSSVDLKTIALPEGERAEFIEDDTQLKFSPDKERIYLIDTRARSGFDFTIDILDLEGNLLAKIKDATNPSWLDNDRIIYRKYSNEDAGYLYTYDLTTQQSTKIEKSTNAAYAPKIQGSAVVFWDASGLGKTYLLDISKNELTTISEDSAYILWLSDKEVIFAKTRLCQANECQTPNSQDYFSQFVADKYFIYNTETKTEIEIAISKDVLVNGILTSQNKHN